MPHCDTLYHYTYVLHIKELFVKNRYYYCGTLHCNFADVNLAPSTESIYMNSCRIQRTEKFQFAEYESS